MPADELMTKYKKCLEPGEIEYRGPNDWNEGVTRFDVIFGRVWQRFCRVSNGA